jgi:hypothetical protein
MRINNNKVAQSLSGPLQKLHFYTFISARLLLRAKNYLLPAASWLSKRVVYIPNAIIQAIFLAVLLIE